MKPSTKLPLACAAGLTLAGLVSGCLGSSEEAASHRAALTSSSEATPLPTVAERQWHAAPAGCQGQLGPSLRYGVAKGQPALVAALDERDVVCVDSFEAIEAELDAIGATAAREDVRERYRASAFGGQLRPLRDSGESAPDHPDEEEALGDPSPQPSTPVPPQDSGNAEGDPSPQPSDPPRAGSDPSPQPSSPADSDTSGDMTLELDTSMDTSTGSSTESTETSTSTDSTG